MNIYWRNSGGIKASLTAKKSHYHFKYPEFMKYCLKVLLCDVSGWLAFDNRLYFGFLMEIFDIFVRVYD